LATAGATPIAEIQFADYIYPAFDQVIDIRNLEFPKKDWIVQTVLAADRYCDKQGLSVIARFLETIA
jgi:hypothetical protein